jgi:hypothetical protein
MFNDIEYKIALGRILKFITSRGYSVNLRSNSFAVIEEEQLVTAPHNASGVNLICSLLHEAGHIVQSKSNFSSLRKSIKRDKAIIYEQEYQAWFLGWQIAEELNIDSPELYITYRQSWLTHWSSYIQAVNTETQSHVITEWVRPYIET